MKAICDRNLFLYADDSALLVADRDVNRVQVRVWLADSKLSLHLGQTESIIFGSKYKLNKTSQLKIKVGDYTISPRTTANYLGCVLDNNLNGVSMAMKVLGKNECQNKVSCLSGSVPR